MVFALFYNIMILVPIATIFIYLIDSSVLNLMVPKGTNAKYVTFFVLGGSLLHTARYAINSTCIVQIQCSFKEKIARQVESDILFITRSRHTDSMRWTEI